MTWPWWELKMYVCMCVCVRACVCMQMIQLSHWSLWLMHSRHSDSRNVHGKGLAMCICWDCCSPLRSGGVQSSNGSEHGQSYFKFIQQNVLNPKYAPLWDNHFEDKWGRNHHYFKSSRLDKDFLNAREWMRELCVCPISYIFMSFVTQQICYESCWLQYRSYCV